MTNPYLGWGSFIEDWETSMPTTVEELAELRATFDLRWKADMRAIRRWQEAHPERGPVWPDHADLVVWLMEQHDAMVQAHAAWEATKASHGCTCEFVCAWQPED